jgi:hypothetical protein
VLEHKHVFSRRKQSRRKRSLPISLLSYKILWSP